MARPRSFDEKEVLQTAMLAFWRDGYEAVTFRSLSAETGLALRSLSNAFGDKEALYIRALENYVKQIEEKLPAMLEGKGARSLVMLFEHLSAEHPSTSPRHFGCFVINQLAVAHKHDERLRAVVDRYFDCLTHAYAAALAADGVVDAEVRARQLVTVFVGAQLTIRLAGDTRAAGHLPDLISELIDKWVEEDN